MQNNKKATRKEKRVSQAEANQSTKTENTNSHTLYFRFALIVALLAFGLYANSLKNGFVLDDDSVITKNHIVQQGISAIPTILKTPYRYGYWGGDDEIYRPVPLIIFAAIWQLFPNNPFPGHLMNVLLYGMCGFFLFLVLRKILSNYNILIPFTASIIFIAHPLHTEVVANIKSLDEIISFLFTLFTFLFLFHYTENNKVKHIILSLLCFTISLFSKESAITILGIIPLTLYFFRGIAIKKIIAISILFLIPAGIYLLMRNQALEGIVGTKQFYFIDNILANAPDYSTRLATIFIILLNYLRLVVFPHPLSSDYSTRQIELSEWNNPLVIISLCIHIALFIYALIGIKKKSILSYGILFFFITLSIYSNLFFMIGSHFGERFLFTPLLGAALAIAIFLSKIFKINDRQQGSASVSVIIKNNKAFFIILLLFLIPYSYKTVARNTDWQSNYTLFTTDPKNAPHSARLHFMQASAIMEEKVPTINNPEEKKHLLDFVISEYDKAIELYPSYAFAYTMRGSAYYKRGYKQKAIESYSKSIELDQKLYFTYNDLGSLYFDSEEYPKALEFFLYTVKLNPQYANGWSNIGATYGSMKQYDKAIEAFSKGLQLAPNDPDMNYYLGSTYQDIGDSTKAKVFLDKAKALNFLSK